MRWPFSSVTPPASTRECRPPRLPSTVAAISEKSYSPSNLRNARTHTLHSPVAYKAEEVGRLFLRGEIPTPSDYR